MNLPVGRLQGRNSVLDQRHVDVLILLDDGPRGQNGGRVGRIEGERATQSGKGIEGVLCEYERIKRR